MRASKGLEVDGYVLENWAHVRWLVGLIKANATYLFGDEDAKENDSEASGEAQKPATDEK